MKLDLAVLDKRLAEKISPEPADEALKAAGEAFVRLLRRYGYPDTPATPSIARYAARLKLHGQLSTAAPPRGLALMGAIGTGKTTAMVILSAAFGWSIEPVFELALEYAAGGDEWLGRKMLDWRGRQIVLDDLGSESEVKHFGSKLPIRDILAVRYQQWQLSGTITHLTGNLSAKERRELYGARIADRIAEMCEVVPCCWPSFRAAGKGIDHIPDAAVESRKIGAPKL